LAARSPPEALTERPMCSLHRRCDFQRLNDALAGEPELKRCELSRSGRSNGVERLALQNRLGYMEFRAAPPGRGDRSGIAQSSRSGLLL
jgi:hypothetical protein